MIGRSVGGNYLKVKQLRIEAWQTLTGIGNLSSIPMIGLEIEYYLILTSMMVHGLIYQLGQTAWRTQILDVLAN